MTSFPAVINLSSLDGSNGFQISISNSSGLGYFGLTASFAAGDINGDGFDDLIIGDPDDNSYTGAAYVVFGKASGFPANFVLSGVDGSSGFKIAGRGGYFGEAVAPAGDVNGDGFADLIIGAPGFAPPGRYHGGGAFVVFGAASGFGANFNASSINGSNGFEIDGAAAFDNAGWPVSSAGDVNGDGFADVIVSAQPHTAPNTSAGVSYVVFGRASGFGASLSLSSLDGSNGFTITGEMPGDYSHAVGSAGDFNADGFSDLLIKTPSASYIVFGKASGFAANLNLSNLNGGNGFKINDNADRIASAGDVNRDGFADIIIGDGGDGNAAGTSYVVFGNASGFPDLSGLNGSNGFKITGEAVGDHSGVSVGSAGDVNGDGFDDVIIGAPHAGLNGKYSGASYVVFGKASGFAASLALSSLDGTNGFKVAGAAPRDFTGWSVSSAGDVNGDGVADIAIAGPNRSSYVVFGRFSGSSAQGQSADFNADHMSDILWRNDNGAFVIWEMNGAVLQKDVVVPGAETISQSWHIAGTGDFNADGKSDILWRNDNGAVAIWEMNGTALQNGKIIPGAEAISQSWHIAGTGDFNADGKSDILWRNDNGAVAVWGMNGTALQNGKIIPGAEAISQSWHIAGTGDFNADGMSDILWRNDNGAVAVWEMNGTALQNGKIIPGAEAISQSWHIAGTGDFNADGMSDILWRNDNGAVAIWEMNGTSLQNGAVVPGAEAISQSWHIAGTGDFNADGMSDILWRNDSGGVAIWEMNGTSLQNGAVVPGAEALPQSWHIEGYGLLLS